MGQWVRENPVHAIGRQALGEGYYRAGRLDEAQALYESALAELTKAVRPQMSFVERGDAEALLKRFQSAEAD